MHRWNFIFVRLAIFLVTSLGMQISKYLVEVLVSHPCTILYLYFIGESFRLYGYSDTYTWKRSNYIDEKHI